LVQSPLNTLQRIYGALEIGGWNSAREPIAARIAKGKAYQAEPVVLEPAAEQRLQDLFS
jgi:hypothetical protein